MKLPILAALLMLVAITPAPAQDDDETNAIDDTPHITIVGTASADVPPDLATISLGVASHQPTAVAAANAVAAGLRAFVDAAKADGVQPPDIATQSVSLGQAYDDVRDPDGRVTGRKPSGFDASSTISIRTRDLAKVGALAQDLIEKGANAFDGIAFTVEHPQPILDKLAASAVAGARRQAEMVAQAVGVKLGRILLIERPEETSRPGGIAPMMRAAAVPVPPMPVEAGTTHLSAEMEVTFAIDR